MANVFDYVDWRGDVPFSTDPFNEVDNILFSELAYVDFDGIVPGPLEEGGGVSIEEAADKFWATHSEEEEMAKTTFFKLAPFLLKKLKGCERYRRIKITRYVNVISAENNEQISAVTFFLPDFSVFVAYRGTDNTIVGWKEDFCLSFTEETSGQRKAVAYLNDLGKQLYHSEAGKNAKVQKAPIRIRVGGHSKGGNFAVYAAAFCDEDLKEHITEIYTNDGPGFLESVTQTPEYQSILSRVHSFIPEESVFGLLLEEGYTHNVVKSSEWALMQHDILSWEVLRNRLVPAQERTKKSLLTQKALDAWIDGLPMDERKRFVDALFDLLAGSGAETLGEFKLDPITAFMDLLRSYRIMTYEEQKVMRETIFGLLRSSKDTLAEFLHMKWQKSLESRGQKPAEIPAKETEET